ncbi:MAG: hypothetical protein O2805_09110 [Proteobacteria bacterium]|nr:hypothetical protein [Pseudomonadota bacterium]
MPLKSKRLTLAPMTHDDFELFVRDILTDPEVYGSTEMYLYHYNVQHQDPHDAPQGIDN